MNTHLSLVNQKLGFATAILAQTNGTPNIKKHKLLHQALCESILLHLYSAYLFYLRELAENNKVDNAESVSSLKVLTTLLGQMERHPSEVAELVNLTEQPNTWLSEFLRHYMGILQSPLKPKEKKAFDSDNFISVVDISQCEPDLKELDPDLLDYWINEFKVLIVRQRETGAEY
jgi:hypothetical protein